MREQAAVQIAGHAGRSTTTTLRLPAAVRGISATYSIANGAPGRYCYDGRKYQKRIAANLADGLRRGVNSTPTFVIGSKMYPGMRTYDEMKKLVDSVARSAPSPVASSSPTTPATRK